MKRIKVNECHVQHLMFKNTMYFIFLITVLKIFVMFLYPLPEMDVYIIFSIFINKKKIYYQIFFFKNLFTEVHLCGQQSICYPLGHDKKPFFCSVFPKQLTSSGSQHVCLLTCQCTRGSVGNRHNKLAAVVLLWIVHQNRVVLVFQTALS